MPGIMSEAAEDVQDILDKEGQPCIFTTVGIDPVVTVTCQAVPTAYHKSFDMDFAGEYQPAQQVSKTARLMVSENALEVLGYPVRNVDNRVALKGHKVMYTEPGDVQAAYVITEQFPNYMTGLIRLQLTEFTEEETP